MLTEKTATSKDKCWHLYIIENRLNQLYTGITTDPTRRLSEHAENSTKSAKALRGKGPLKLRFCTQVGSKPDALRLELWVKRQPRHIKLDLINGKVELPR